MPTEIIINGKFLGAGPTGVHRVAWELMRALDAAEMPLRFRALTPRVPLSYPALGDIPFEAAGRLNGQAWEQFSLPRAAAGRPILSLCNLAPVLPARAVTMIHDAQVFTTPESYGRAFGAYYRAVLRAVGRRHARILTVSEYSRGQLAALGIAPAERITVIHNGADHILRVPAARDTVARLGLRPHGYVVALANTQAHKNIGLLLRAFARPELERLTLVLVGTATAAEFAAASHPVPANVRFAGAVDDAALRALMEHALCLAFPSLTEGFGLPPVEAMLLGCPAVIAPCGALPEVCGEPAVQADPRDPAAWSAALLALSGDDPAWRSRSAAGRAWAARFTWAAAAGRLCAVLAPFAANSHDRAARGT